MPLVATLISHPAARTALAAAGDYGVRSGRRKRDLAGWPTTSPATSPCPTASARPRRRDPARAALSVEPLDIVVQEAETRRKKILIADMDSTMIDQECIDELADEVGLKDHVAAITARSMNGEIAFEPALRERVALLKGLDAAVIDRIIAAA